MPRNQAYEAAQASPQVQGGYGLEMEVFNIISDLENLLETGGKVPFSNKYSVDRDRALDILQELRERLPLELRDAANLLRQENRILQNAHRTADSTVAEADANAKQILEDAQSKADQIVAEAETRSREREQSSEEAAKRTLESAERKAEERTANTAIMKRAEMQAKEILANAQGEAQRLYLMNLDHCEALLKQVEDKSIEIADQLRRSRNELMESR